MKPNEIACTAASFRDRLDPLLEEVCRTLGIDEKRAKDFTTDTLFEMCCAVPGFGDDENEEVRR